MSDTAPDRREPSPDAEATAAPSAGRPPARVSVRTHLGFGVALVLLAAVLVVAAGSDSPTTTDRLGRRVELVELIRVEQGRAEALSERVDDLAAQVAAFEEPAITERDAVAALQSQVDQVAASAGLTAVRGPGVEVTLRDSVLETSPSGDPNDLVIHEQDLQAVINALWAGGAEAMSVNGQRVLATTAIRCVGNTLLLHGAVYSPPYVISAIGDDVTLQASLGRDPAVARFSSVATQYQLGYETVVVDAIDVPAHEGIAAMSVARPPEASAG